MPCFKPKTQSQAQNTQPAASPWRWKLQELVKQIRGSDVGKTAGTGNAVDVGNALRVPRRKPAARSALAYMQELCELRGVDLACSLGRL